MKQNLIVENSKLNNIVLYLLLLHSYILINTSDVWHYLVQ
ncbi:hypothetical protein RintRC_2186 [Richelia intracellularis]|nr:hypothetical protein RintRC_2186 [Richelia intracellularis]